MLKKKPVFDVLKEMTEKKMDVFASPASEIVEISGKFDYAIVKIKTDRQVFFNSMIGKPFRGGLFLADKKQYEEIEKRGTEESVVFTMKERVYVERALRLCSMIYKEKGLEAKANFANELIKKIV